MSLKSVFGGRRKNKVSLKSKRRPRQSGGLNFHTLEPRHLLAGIFFDSGTGEVTVAGGSGNDVGTFSQPTSTTYRATLTGFSDQTFTATQVTKIIFIGFAGNDTFTNQTVVGSLLLGNDGNDILIGGPGIDVMNGGNGDDQLTGGDGNDRLIGNNGNDTMSGGNGNDRMFGGPGINLMNGNDGDDLMFGGDDVDTMNGGEGADGLYPLGGDDIISLGNGGTPGATDLAFADLVIAGDGNDTMSGGSGLNVFYGSDGDDIFNGGDGENRMHGQNGNDQLNSGSANDYLAGQVGNDTINGGGGNDYILPGFGDDIVNAGAGNDYVAFNTQFSDYQITTNGTILYVHDTRLVDGTDETTGVESFRFSDGDRIAKANITQRVVVQPIIVSNSNGSNTAAFFGSSTQEADVKFKIDDIFLQAGIDVSWLAPNTYNNSFANVGNGGTRPQSDLTTVTNSGPGNSNPLVIDMYFVEVAAGFNDTGEDVANGLAFVGSNGITIHIGDNLASFEAGRDVIARVAAHEIGHNLGLDHVSSITNLMGFSGDGQFLNSSQVTTVLASSFSVPV